MPDPFKAQLTPVNPLPESKFPADMPDQGLNETGSAMAREGYSVLNRANPRDAFNRNRRGIAPPVDNDFPNVAWDERK